MVRTCTKLPEASEVQSGRAMQKEALVMLLGGRVVETLSLAATYWQETIPSRFPYFNSFGACLQVVSNTIILSQESSVLGMWLQPTINIASTIGNFVAFPRPLDVK